jgi:hypothetical protein
MSHSHYPLTHTIQHRTFYTMPNRQSHGTGSAASGRGYAYPITSGNAPSEHGRSPNREQPVKPKREYSNERSAQGLLKWLNDSSNDDPHTRIRNLLRDLHYMAGSWELVDDGEGGGYQLRESRIPKFRKAAQRARRLFCSYKFYPMVWPFGPGFIQQWAPISGPDGKFGKRWPPIADEYTDNQAIFELTWLMPNNNILRVRECRNCGRWLYARFGHQRFCSAGCRDKANKSTLKWREYRREKAREYYWLHKSKNVK